MAGAEVLALEPPRATRFQPRSVRIYLSKLIFFWGFRVVPATPLAHLDLRANSAFLGVVGCGKQAFPVFFDSLDNNLSWLNPIF